MFLPPISICEALQTIIAFRSKFPAVHKITIKREVTVSTDAIVGLLKILNLEGHIPNVFSITHLGREIL